MRRTTVYLPDELKAALERAATAEGKSEAEVVRAALAAATKAHVPRRRAWRCSKGPTRRSPSAWTTSSPAASAIDPARHQRSARRARLEPAPAYRSSREPRRRKPLLLSPFVLAELDYLVSSRVGRAARLSLLEEVEPGAYLLEPFSNSDIEEGLAPRGHLFIDLDTAGQRHLTFKVRGDVTCHRVLGNMATVGGALRRASLGPSPRGPGVHQRRR